MEAETLPIDHRPFEENDAAVISRFAQSEEELFFFLPKAAFPLEPVQLIAQARETTCPTVALWNNAVAGYVHFIEVRQRGFCTIGSLIVAPEFRRKGVATHLIQTMIKKSEAQFCARFVHAACFSHNTPAYQLYAKLGFTPADMVLRPATDGEMVLLVHMHRRTGF